VAANFHSALAQIVLQITIAQIERVVGRRHASAVGVPVEQVEGHRVFAAHVVVDHIGPDQVSRAQHVKGTGHFGPIEIALFGHGFFDLGNLFLIDEDLEITRIGEIHLSGKKRGGLYARVLLCGHHGQGDRQQGTANTIADGIDLGFAGYILNHV